MKFAFALCGLALAAASASAQDSTIRSDPNIPRSAARPAWVSGGDAVRIGIWATSVALISTVDETVAKEFQKPSVRGNHFLQHSANGIQLVGDPGALLISLSLYAIGATTHHPGLADASLHSTESIAVSGAITQLLKLGVGRERPNLSHDENAYAFHPLHGYKADFNSFPSGHTTASFAAATAFSEEIARLHPRASGIATPLLYGVATLVGGARMYNDRHWLSDVVGGALIGHFVGKRITAHAHGTP